MCGSLSHRSHTSSAAGERDRVEDEDAGRGEEEEKEPLQGAGHPLGRHRAVVGQAHIVPVLLPRVPCRRHGGDHAGAERTGQELPPGGAGRTRIVTGCYGGIALGPDRGTPDGGDDDSGRGIQASAGFQIDTAAGGRLGVGAAAGQTDIHKNPEGHTPTTTWFCLELRYTQRVPVALPVAPVVALGGLIGDSTDGSVLGARAIVGAETRSVPVTFGAGLVPQIIRYDRGTDSGVTYRSSVRSLHVALWLARAPLADRERAASASAAPPGSTDRTPR